MHKTANMIAVEGRIGRPIEKAIVELYNLGCTRREVAERLGLSIATLTTWEFRLRISRVHHQEAIIG